VNGKISAGDRGKRLAEYRRKRSAERTPEPFGGGAERPGLFVVQKHAARNLHYDLRIEVGGVLKSWAVPKGPSLDPAEKRFAVATEDHPLEYADFEGVIPEGNYGAGAMIVWDRGLCVPHLDHAEGLEKGKLLFELRGYKLRGLFTLVRTKKEREWLLIKKPDGHATGEDADGLGAESVFSGLTVEELRAGHHRGPEIRARLEEVGASQEPVAPAEVGVMLCELQREAFSRPGWLFEIKYDGFRLVAAKEGGGRRGARLFFRSGMESTVAFPDLVRALAALPYGSLVLDGEVTVLDDDGKPSFHQLQQRGRLTRPADAERAAVRLPATYFVFDLLGFEDFDLRPLPLRERKEILRRILPRAGPLRYADHVEERGEDFYAAVRRMGLEGMVAKKADAPYRSGRSSAWIKVRADRTGDFAVVGYTRPEGSRTGFKALHLAVLEGGRLAYRGRVGSGFDEARLREIRERLEPLEREAPPFAGEAPSGPEQVWVDPELVVEVRYTEVSPAGHLRHPVFLRLRDDKKVEDCVSEEASVAKASVAKAVAESVEETGEGTAPESPESVPERRPELRFTNLDKVFWPGEGTTKGDLIDYYRTVARWILPYLRDRPVVLDRYPDGIDGKSFFQKNVPDFAPDWIRTETLWSEDGGGETLYFIADDADTLLYLVNLGTIPLHLRASRVSSLQSPDWCILDLDAKEAPFASVIEVAQAIHRLCRKIGLDAFAKTSGATGLHVLLPLASRSTFEQARLLGELLARVVAHELPEISSITRATAARKGRVYVDFLQNGYGKLLVAPFSVRPRPGATVSTPLLWEEVKEGLDPRELTIETVPERFRRLGEDPLLPVFDRAPDLAAVLGRLAAELGGDGAG